MLNKKLFAGAVFALAMFAFGTASAYTFDSQIDTLQEKKDVQTVLNMATGSTLTVDGVLGAKTIAAVKAFQTLKGLTVDGKIGPMTRAALTAASVGGTTTADLCPNGMTLASNCVSAPSTTATVTLCPNGMTLASNCVSAPSTTGTVVTGTTDGSLSGTTSSYVSSGISIKKGETKDVAAVRLQASVGPVKVSRVDVTFNVRPWLFFSTVSLHDNSGKVLATKTLSSIADVTELTVGSLYQVRFEGLSYAVTPGTNPDLAVSASVLSATDKIPSGGQPVTVNIPSIKTINEVGYTETIAPASVSNTVTLTSTGSVADIYSRIAPSSPLTGQQVVNANNTTTDVTLGAFSLKSSNNASTLNTLKVAIGGTSTATTNFSNFRLYVGGVSIAGGTLSSGVITFSNLTTPLALDAWTDLTIKADIAAAASGTVYLTLTPDTTTVVVTDSNYGTATIESGARTSNTLTLTQNSVTVSGISAVLGSAIVQANVTTGYNATYAFTLTNNSNNDLYVSATPGTFVSTTITGGASAASSALTSVTLSPATVSGDDSSSTPAYYSIPTGTARTFTFAAALRGNTGTATVLKATQINYGTASGATTAYSIATGLSGLSLTASF